MRARRWFEPDCGQTTHDMSRRALELPRSVAEAQLLQERLRDQVVTEDLLGVVSPRSNRPGLSLVELYRLTLLAPDSD